MLRFSANLGFLWPDRPLLGRIEAAAAAGFKAVELHWPYDVPPEFVRQACERHGLTLLGLNTPAGDPAKGDFGLAAVPGREAEFQAGFDRAVSYCRASGAIAIHAMAGVVPTELRAKARAVFKANLMQAADKAAVHDLTVILEAINPRDKPGYFYSKNRPRSDRRRPKPGRAGRGRNLLPGDLPCPRRARLRGLDRVRIQAPGSDR